MRFLTMLRIFRFLTIDANNSGLIDMVRFKGGVLLAPSTDGVLRRTSFCTGFRSRSPSLRGAFFT
jgi:hypothetical protein